MSRPSGIRLPEEPETHGGPDWSELSRLGLQPDDVLDFSVSTNAFGPPPGVLDAVASCDVTRYPDRRATPLREALAAWEGVSPDCILVGNGAAQLIWTLALAWLRPGDAAFIVGPTFGEYRRASLRVGAQVVEWRAAATTDFAPDLDQLAGALAACRPRLIWLCNPNNPTGFYLDRTAIARLRAAAPEAIWVRDEAYLPFVASARAVQEQNRPGVAMSPARWSPEGTDISLRSLTKAWAIPGLRLGYLLAAPQVVAACDAALPPWSTGAPAIAAGLAALADSAHVTRSVGLLRAEAERLRAALQDQGWRVPPSATHFMLIEVGAAAAVRAHLLAQYRIQVRDCASFGLPEFVRVAARRPEENDRLLAALEELK